MNEEVEGRCDSFPLAITRAVPRTAKGETFRYPPRH
ncbi:unnamed protein product [Penicillium roqueforti FM164]|uniref:Genomic scaffold, ProqFM164S04 n=1 Tax=Penicillium roqueforti (strain FM164) TaxID=1365484 RepID=W6QF92_PENRF|nr:unnamed protein product [Penicillium roqueforti FM164]